MMKTLIINGSPHANGSTAYLVGKLKEQLAGDIDEVNTYKLKFNPCIDCGSCLKGGGCPFDDDVSDLLGAIDTYNCIVAATPLYYNQPTGSFMNFASRLQYEFAQNIVLKSKNPPSKKAGIIVCGGGDSVINSADAEKTLRIVLRQINAKAVAYARSLHTSTIPVRDDVNAIADISAMVKKLIQ